MGVRIPTQKIKAVTAVPPMIRKVVRRISATRLSFKGLSACNYRLIRLG
jgi:hypothetical protein